MRKIKIFMAGVLTITFFTVVHSVELLAFEQILNESGMQEIRTENGIVMRWKVDDSSLIVMISAKTTGWVAVGFDPTQAMKDANFIIGYVKEGRVYARDDFGTERGKHTADTKLGGTDDVTVLEGIEKDGVTEILFSIPLDSGDSRDKPLQPGAEYAILLAYGKSDSYSAVHEIEAEAKGTIRL